LALEVPEEGHIGTHHAELIREPSLFPPPQLKNPTPPYNVRGCVLYQKVTSSKPSLFPQPQARPFCPTFCQNVGQAGLGCGSGNSNNSETFNWLYIYYIYNI
jgi:hypothetical protein